MQNWFGDLDQSPAVVVKATSVDDIVATLTDTEQFPAPVRAIGSNHSTTRCGFADGGTVIDVTALDQIVEIGDDYVTTQAGALYIDVANALEQRGLQFFVNVELGNLTMGSAACGGTKDASMPGEFGQVSSYATRIKLVRPDGELVEITEADGELLTAARSSYGLLGVLYEVTFRVQRLRAMEVRHISYRLDEFIAQLPDLTTSGKSMMFFLYPFLDRIVVEYRHYQDDSTTPKTRRQWRVRNFFWKTFGPGYARFVSQYIPGRRVKTALINTFGRAQILLLERLIRGPRTSPTDQLIRYPPKAGFASYTFSIWAFAEDSYPEVLRNYYRFCHDYYDRTGYRCDMVNVGYRVLADQSQLFSYTFDGDALTIDPVSTGQPGWDEFLEAYNEFCSQAGGIPLFNQTKHMTPAQARAAFGNKIDSFNQHRRQFDPADRLLNDYFRQRLR